MKRPNTSLKLALMTTVMICWLVPILIVVTLAGVLLGNSYRQSVQQEMEVTANYAMGQVQMRLKNAVEGSKGVSYDGIVRSAYREYLRDGNNAKLYRTVNDYLSQSFSRDEKFKAVFISFWNESVSQPYVLRSDSTGYEVTLAFRDHTDTILESMAEVDTEIRFLFLDGELYMARNLLDSSFSAYATVVMMFDSEFIFGPLSTLSMVSDVQVNIGGCPFQMDEQGALIVPTEEKKSGEIMEFSAPVDDIVFTVTAIAAEYDLWEDNPWLKGAVVAVALMVLPLLAVMIALFTYHVTKPMQTLARANMLVQSGERGYQIDKRPPNAEFETLYLHFNEMSTELKNQFERSFLEQQASQRAQIKALQSQINPHFLNNTLEIINWEARLADNERVSAMIEALSTMLDAALDRDGRTQIPLKEELGYVDAYLYIIQERLGDGFHIHKEIDQSILDQMIPRLILQPIVENAVEHDITSRHGGNLWVRVYREQEQMALEVEHDGTMSESDREKVHALLTDEKKSSSQVGLRNVHQRLRLIYGQRAELSVKETNLGTILAKICFPAG